MIDLINEITCYVNIAFEIFSKSRYATDVKIIRRLFKSNIEQNVNLSYKEIITLRLTIIDSLYSTNMSKRLYGIEDITDKLAIYSNDDELKKAFLDLINNNNDIQILKVFDENKYGINKNGKDAGHSFSLISKYAYFLTDYEFPIYDSLVIRGHNFLSEKYQELEKLPQNADFKYPQLLEYFRILKRFNYFLKLNNKEENIKFEKLDCFLWMIGKIQSGSFQNLISKEEYIEFINKVKNLTSDDISSFLAQDKLKNNKNIIMEAINSDVLRIFTQYALN